MRRPTRRGFLAATGLAALAGCTGGGATGGSPEPTPSSATAGTPTGRTADCGEADETGGSPTPGSTDVAATSDAGSADSPRPFPTTDERLPLPMTSADLRGESRSGGPAKDGIPSIDDPQFVGADAADFLDDRDVVFGVVREGVARAYPQPILASHEIVNDTLAGTPVAVTYCPLTGTAMGFHRGETTFGVSGRLINNNLVMYDRATETWWPQILATSIPGPWNETPETRSLTEFRLIWTRWEHWRRQHPDTEVLSTETGYARNYRTDPYGSYTPLSGYYEGGSPMFPDLSDDERYDPKTVVVGARTADGAVAFHEESLRQAGVLTGLLGERPVLAVYDPRYDTGYVYANPGERSFAFDADCGHVVADGTTYAPDSLPLSRIYAFDAMWFAWSGYYPETTVAATASAGRTTGTES
jgi:hypothetical protein